MAKWGMFWEQQETTYHVYDSVEAALDRAALKGRTDEHWHLRELTFFDPEGGIGYSPLSVEEQKLADVATLRRAHDKRVAAADYMTYAKVTKHLPGCPHAAPGFTRGKCCCHEVARAMGHTGIAGELRHAHEMREFQRASGEGDVEIR